MGGGGWGAKVQPASTQMPAIEEVTVRGNDFRCGGGNSGNEYRSLAAAAEKNRYVRETGKERIAMNHESGRDHK